MEFSEISAYDESSLEWIRIEDSTWGGIIHQ